MLLDQDSLPPAGLLAELNRRLKSLTDKGTLPAVLGPNRIVINEDTHKTSRYRRDRRHEPVGSMVAVEFVISSGSLIPCDAFEAVGPFRADFFIDAIDVEWCLRARSMGRSCWLARDVLMPHQLGSGVIEVPLAGVLLVRQPPKRIYTFIRNQLLMVRHSGAPVSWRIRAVVRVLVHSICQPFASPRQAGMLKWIAAGWMDALRGRTGAP
jgi:rhamnosyltransferase